MKYSNESVLELRILKASDTFEIFIQLCLKISHLKGVVVPVKLYFCIAFY